VSDGPRMPEVGVIAIVPDHFDEPWQSRHQVLTRLSSYFHVVWVEPTPEWRQMLWHPRKSDTRESIDTAARGFALCEPVAWLPVVHKPVWLGQRLARARLARARRMLVTRGCRKIVLSLWRPPFARVIDLVRHDAVVYHIDDEYTFANVEAAQDRRELELIKTADVVTVTSPGLLQRKGGINPKTVFVPNGVDYASYATPATEPADLAAIPHPRIGYTGYVKSQLDWDLMRMLMAAHPQWQFVFVGPKRLHDGIGPILQTLESLPNVHFLPAKRQKELATYPQHFDVCVMPYQANGYTKYIYPLKLHEYLASGRPVVGTRLPSFEEFGDVVSLASTAAEWTAAIAAALGPTARAESARAARQKVAREYDWSNIARRMADAIASAFDRDGVPDREV